MSDLLVTSATAVELGIANTGTNYTILSAITQRVDAILEGLCNRPSGFLSASHTELIDGATAQLITLTYVPVTGSPVITINDQTIDSDLYTIETDTGIIGFKSSDYDIWFSGGIPNLHGLPVYDFSYAPNWGNGFRNVSVVYTGGYASAAVPQNLKQAALDITAYIWFKKGRDPGLMSKKLGDLSWTARDDGGFRAFLDQICDMYLTGTLIRHPVVFT